MKNFNGNKSWTTTTSKNGRVFTWKAKTEEAWKNKENADFSNWKEWVCVGTKEA